MFDWIFDIKYYLPEDFIQLIDILIMISIVSIGTLIPLSPSLFFIFYIKNKIKNLDIRIQYVMNIISVAFFVPFVNCLYYLILFDFIPKTVNVCWVGFVLPVTAIISLIASILKRKNYTYIIVTCLLMLLFGSVFDYYAQKIFVQEMTKIELKLLVPYNSVITQIKSQKSKTGHYPKDIKALKIPEDGGYEVINYETKENGKDFIFTVKDSEYALEFFSYCSNPKYEECHAHETYPMEYIQRGEWIKGINHD